MDSLDDTAPWAREVGITFPLLSDPDGVVSKSFGLFDTTTGRSARAVALISGGVVSIKHEVTATEVPKSVLPEAIK